MLVLTTNAMTYFLLQSLHYARTFASVRADEVVTRPGDDVRTSPHIRLPHPYRCYRHLWAKTKGFQKTLELVVETTVP